MAPIRMKWLETKNQRKSSFFCSNSSRFETIGVDINTAQSANILCYARFYRKYQER